MADYESIFTGDLDVKTVQQQLHDLTADELSKFFQGPARSVEGVVSRLVEERAWVAAAEVKAFLRSKGLQEWETALGNLEGQLGLKTVLQLHVPLTTCGKIDTCMSTKRTRY